MTTTLEDIVKVILQDLTNPIRKAAMNYPEDT
jgi:hypothetical protein